MDERRLVGTKLNGTDTAQITCLPCPVVARYETIRESGVKINQCIQGSV